ncbi:hypothetical protein TNCV_118781 [Trichonephila clavipes]|nr:hypothetical protein TNCV_118781 [Trichonephila clavipes]
MPRNRFQKLKSYLHFVDNGSVSQNVPDLSFKVKSLSAMLNNTFMKFGGESLLTPACMTPTIRMGYSAEAG